MANNHFYRGRFNKVKTKEQNNFIRANFYIRAANVRVVQEDGSQLGVLQIDAARKIALDQGLDLVEIVPNANPPVCKITNFDKYRYEQKQKEKQSKKNQKETEIKEVRLRPCTQQNDIETKANAIERFLSGGAKVVVNLEYKRRELHHRDEGYKVMQLILERVRDFANIEAPPKMQGAKLTCILTAKPKVNSE